MQKARRNALTAWGKRVKKRQIDLNISNTELCRIIGCSSRTYLNDILIGRRSGGKYVALICETLKMPCDQQSVGGR